MLFEHLDLWGGRIQWEESLNYNVKERLASSAQHQIFAIPRGEKPIPGTGTCTLVPAAVLNNCMCWKSCPAPVAFLFFWYIGTDHFLAPKAVFSAEDAVKNSVAYSIPFYGVHNRKNRCGRQKKWSEQSPPLFHSLHLSILLI